LTQKNIKNNNLLLDIHDLNVFFNTPEGISHVVKDVNFNIKKGTCLGVVGESGSGKTQTFFSITGLLANNGYAEGEAFFKNTNLITCSNEERRGFLGKSIGFIFQDPMTSLTPHLKIGDQLAEIAIYHKKINKKKALERAVEVMDIVKLPSNRDIINSYPHELSGGMKQRIMIAISLMCEPDLIIADEPTTALDVTTQAEILNIFNDLKNNLNIGLVLISHNIGVIAETSNEVLVMKDGEILENGETSKVLTKPENKYTQHLLSCIPPWIGN
tara:strand:+ start:196 stop:1011 length:816 start_codon:yes stop_codon:yes gene_type:complete